jgi:hypothetical protein
MHWTRNTPDERTRWKTTDCVEVTISISLSRLLLLRAITGKNSDEAAVVAAIEARISEVLRAANAARANPELQIADETD